MRLCCIAGDGIGIEVMEAAKQILAVLPLPIETVDAEAGWGVFERTGTALPDATVELAKASDAILFGAVASPSHPVPGYRSPIVGLRRTLDLYANIRPVRSLPLPSPALPTVDLVVVRENTEGLYAGRERLEDHGATAIAERVITRRGSERIVRKAYQIAQQRLAMGHTTASVTIVHKANVLRVSDGLFREVALEVARQYPTIATRELLVDTAAMFLAQKPAQFDVIVTTNMFGDILSDIACIHGGGLGVASSANIGDQLALFEPVHGAAPDIAGKGIANPLAMIGCLVMLFQWYAANDHGTEHAAIRTQFQEWAMRLREAIEFVLCHGPWTPDMPGGQHTTQEVTSAIVTRLV